MFDSDYRHHVSPHLRAAMDRLRDPQAVWEIFRRDDTIAEMVRLTALKRPALGATSAKLLTLGDWVRGKDARKTFGKLTRCMMEVTGYVVELRNVETPKDPLVTKGTRYRRREPTTPEPATTTLTVRNISAALKARLEMRAADNGRSSDAEVLYILTQALNSNRQGGEVNLAEAIRRRFASLGGVDDLEPHPPVSTETPPAFEP
jgi:plasmid stability protein